jgi:hypothetical protein
MNIVMAPTCPSHCKQLTGGGKRRVNIGLLASRCTLSYGKITTTTTTTSRTHRKATTVLLLSTWRQWNWNHDSCLVILFLKTLRCTNCWDVKSRLGDVWWSWMANLAACRRKWSWPVLGLYSGIWLEGVWNTPTQFSTGIWKKNLPSARETRWAIRHPRPSRRLRPILGKMELAQ